MFASRRPKGFVHLRNWRGLLAVLVASMYLLSGALHASQCVDVANPFGQSELAWTQSSDGVDVDGKTLNGHHCHGCFSVTVGQLVQPDAITELATAPNPPRLTTLVGVVPDTDSPPPKYLA